MYRVVLVILFLLFNIIVEGQSEEMKPFLDANYVGGEETFAQQFYTKLRYPRKAREKCVIGKSIVHVHISATNNMDSVSFSNVLGSGIEEAIETALLELNGNWIPGPNRTFTFSIGFQIGLEPIDGYIKVNAVATVNGRMVENCAPTRKELMEKFTKLVKKEKYKKASKILNQLLKRDPESEHYLGLEQFLIGKSDN